MFSGNGSPQEQLHSDDVVRENEIIRRLMASGIADIQAAIGCSSGAAILPSSFVAYLDRRTHLAVAFDSATSYYGTPTEMTS